MENHKTDKAFACLIAGFWLVDYIDCQGRKRLVKIKPLRRDFGPFLEDFFYKCYENALSQEFLSKSDYDDFLAENGVCIEKLDSEMEFIRLQIENMKVEAFDNFLDEFAVISIKSRISQSIEKLVELNGRKYQYYHLSAEGYADIEKNRLAVALSCYKMNDRRLVRYSDYNTFPAYILEQIACSVKDIKPTESDIRKIARGQEWGAMFGASKKCKLFKAAVSDMFDEQISLINWSLIYQSVHSHPEKPSSIIFEDDILMDGWLIKQRRKGEQQSKENAAQETLGDKMKNYGNVFIPAKNKKMVGDIYDLNTEKQRKKINDSIKEGIK